MDPETPISQLRNLGQGSEYWLNKVGIYKLEDLQRENLEEIVRKLQEVGFKASANMLYAMEGALVDKDWKDVAKDKK